MLFKILHGDASRISLDVTPFHEGYCYVTHDGYMYVDMNIGTEEEPNNQRVRLSAADAQTLLGKSISEVLNDSAEEIPTSKAVFEAIENSNPGLYEFVIEGDDLVIHYTGSEPNFYIDENGHLIAPAAEGNTIDLGRVVGEGSGGSGDMSAQVYDPQGKAQDIFAYVDSAATNANAYTDRIFADISIPDVNGLISEHNSSTSAHADIRQEISDLRSSISNIQQTVGTVDAMLDSINGEVV